MSALDDLLDYFSGLSVQSIDVPSRKVATFKASKPTENTAKRLRVKRSFGGKLSPTRYGGSTTQTRVYRMRQRTPQDIAASLTAVKDPVARELVTLTVLPFWQCDLTKLYRGVLCAFLKAAEERKWHPDATRLSRTEVLISQAIHELRSEAACKACNTSGTVFEAQNGWSECTRCGGSGVVFESQRSRHAKLNVLLAPYGQKVSYRAYRERWDAPYTWLLAHLHGLIDEAWHQIKSAS